MKRRLPIRQRQTPRSQLVFRSGETSRLGPYSPLRKASLFFPAAAHKFRSRAGRANPVRPDLMPALNSVAPVLSLRRSGALIFSMWMPPCWTALTFFASSISLRLWNVPPQRWLRLWLFPRTLKGHPRWRSRLASGMDFWRPCHQRISTCLSFTFRNYRSSLMRCWCEQVMSSKKSTSPISRS